MEYNVTNVLYPVASERNSESYGSTAKPGHTFGQDCSMSAKKKKADTKPESPRKRLRCASGPPQLAVEAVPVPRRTKRKASIQRGTPSKKQKSGHTDTSEAIRGTSRKEEDRAEQLPATETPGATNRESGYDSSPGTSSPSSFIQDNWSTSIPLTSIRACFEDKYLELDKLGQGGFGSVYAGRRTSDNLPVAIKHIPKEDVDCQPVVLHGRTRMVPLEVLLMIRVAGGPASVGKSAAVSLLDWYDLEQEFVLVMERPVPSVDLLTYIENNCGPLEEDVAKNIMKQLVDAALKMHAKGVFHRDIKSENLLIETGSDGPRVRVIDFGCGCTVQEEPYHDFCGTSAYAPPEFFTYGRYEAAPTTVWQLGTLLYEMLDGYQQFTTLKFLRRRMHFNNELSQDCQDLLNLCLAQNPVKRATLEQVQLHPWLQNAAEVTPQTNPETP